MAGNEVVLAVCVVFDDLFGERPGIPNVAVVEYEVGVDEPGSCFLEERVEQFEHLSAQKLIVAVNDQKDFVGPAVLQRSPAQIEHSLLLLLIAYHLIIVT